MAPDRQISYLATAQIAPGCQGKYVNNNKEPSLPFCFTSSPEPTLPDPTHPALTTPPLIQQL